MLILYSIQVEQPSVVNGSSMPTLYLMWLCPVMSFLSHFTHVGRFRCSV